jgi:flagellar hook-basal body complex protein FliE
MSVNRIGGPIAPIEPLAVQNAQTTSGAKASGPVDFGEALAGAIGQAHAMEQTSADLSTRFAAGDPEVGMHETMIAAEKASIGLRYAVTLKNKMLEAYRELMNTPV